MVQDNPGFEVTAEPHGVPCNDTRSDERGAIRVSEPDVGVPIFSHSGRGRYVYASRKINAQGGDGEP